MKKTPIIQAPFAFHFPTSPQLLGFFAAPGPLVQPLKKDTQNIAGKLKGFARSILSRHQNAGGFQGGGEAAGGGGGGGVG